MAKTYADYMRETEASLKKDIIAWGDKEFCYNGIVGNRARVHSIKGNVIHVYSFNEAGEKVVRRSSLTKVWNSIYY